MSRLALSFALLIAVSAAAFAAGTVAHSAMTVPTVTAR